MSRYLRDPQHLVLWSIALLAAALRLVHLDLAPFGDEAARQLIGARALLQGNLPLHGVTDCSGITPPALGVYLYAVPMLVSKDPRWVAGFIGLLSVAVLIMLYGSVTRWFGTRVAVFGALLWAVSPWAGLTARTLTAGAFAPLLAALVLVGCEHALNRGQSWGWLLAWLCVWLLVNLSLYYWPSLLFITLISLVYWRRVHWPQVLLASGLGLSLLFPYLYYQSYLRFRDLLSALSLVSNDSFLWRGFGSVLDALHYVSSSSVADLAGSQRAIYYSQRLPFAFIESATVVLCLAGVFAFLARTALQLLRWNERQSAMPYFIVLAWSACCLIGLSRQPAREGLLDLGLIAPAGFTLLGCTLAVCFDAVVHARMPLALRTASRMLLVFGLVLLVLWPLYLYLHLYSYVNTTTARDGYGIPLRFWLQTADSVRNAQLDRPDQTLYITGGGDDGRVFTAAQLRYLLAPDTEIIQMCPEDGNCLVLPFSRPNLHLALQPSIQLTQMLNRLDMREIAQTTQPDARYAAKLYLIKPLSVSEMTNLVQTRDLVTLDNGMLFLGYDHQDASTGYLATYWCLDNQDTSPLPHGLAMRLHHGAATAGESRIGVGIDERYWTLDKVFVRWVPIPVVESGTYGAQIASYRLPDAVLNRTMHISTAAAATAIELPDLIIE